MVKAAGPAWIALWAALAVPSAAQAQLITAERPVSRSYGPAASGAPEEPQCDPAKSVSNEIVVCGLWEEDEKFRAQSTSQLDPESREALNDGVPRAPELGESCKANPEKGSCIGFGSVPPPAYMVDFSELPEAPPGSDADRIAKGEIEAP
jgi:hypothetical protein